MSKLSFRARALDASKQMPIYMLEDLPTDIPDYSAINRAVPQMPSGMEKEEESEHHLQRAMSAGLIIPTPEVADMADAEAYDKIYPSDCKTPRQLIHMQPFAMEQDIPDYDMDSEDECWLESQADKMDINPLKFEEMMDRLEKASGQYVVPVQEAKALLKEDDDLIIAVYDYWLNKRLTTQHPLIPTVKTGDRLGTANNPYNAFRRRTEKMQTRKNRKNDETSYEKMLKLRRDLSRATTLMEMVKRREKTKREVLHLTIEIFEKRYQLGDFSGQLLSEVTALKTPRSAFAPIYPNQFGINQQSWAGKNLSKDEMIPRREKRAYKRRKHKAAISGAFGGRAFDLHSSEDEDREAHLPGPARSEDEDTDTKEGSFTFHRSKNSRYLAPLSSSLGNWPWTGQDEGGLADRRYRFFPTSIADPEKRCIGFARRRVGRGGRILLDRAYSSNENNEFPFSEWRNSAKLHANVSGQPSDSWLHFRPKSPPRSPERSPPTSPLLPSFARVCLKPPVRNHWVSPPSSPLGQAAELSDSSEQEKKVSLADSVVPENAVVVEVSSSPDNIFANSIDGTNKTEFTLAELFSADVPPSGADGISNDVMNSRLGFEEFDVDADNFNDVGCSKFVFHQRYEMNSRTSYPSAAVANYNKIKNTNNNLLPSLATSHRSILHRHKKVDLQNSVASNIVLPTNAPASASPSCASVVAASGALLNNGVVPNWSGDRSGGTGAKVLLNGPVLPDCNSTHGTVCTPYQPPSTCTVGSFRVSHQLSSPSTVRDIGLSSPNNDQMDLDGKDGVCVVRKNNSLPMEVT